MYCTTPNNNIVAKCNFNSITSSKEDHYKFLFVNSNKIVKFFFYYLIVSPPRTRFMVFVVVTLKTENNKILTQTNT